MQKLDQYVFGNPSVTVHTDYCQLEPNFLKATEQSPKMPAVNALSFTAIKEVYKPKKEKNHGRHVVWSTG